VKNHKNPHTTRQLESFDPTDVLHPSAETRVDPRQLARELAARSRRRTAYLAVATVLAWMAACGLAIWAAEIYFNELRPHLPLYEYRYAQLHDAIQGIPWNELTDIQRREYSTRSRFLGRSNETMMLLSQGTIVLFGIAALLSVWLTIASRRSALRQINASLLSITLELSKVISPQSA
jgi:hypothetical protein